MLNNIYTYIVVGAGENYLNNRYPLIKLLIKNIRYKLKSCWRVSFDEMNKTNLLKRYLLMKRLLARGLFQVDFCALVNLW